MGERVHETVGFNLADDAVQEEIGNFRGSRAAWSPTVTVSTTPSGGASTTLSDEGNPVLSINVNGDIIGHDVATGVTGTTTRRLSRERLLSRRGNAIKTLSAAGPAHDHRG